MDESTKKLERVGEIKPIGFQVQRNVITFCADLMFSHIK